MLSSKLLDDIGRQILRILQEDGRISFNELGRRVGLSSPAVAERVRRMKRPASYWDIAQLWTRPA